MSKNAKHFDFYIVFSTFSRALIDVFIPAMMYKSGYSIKNCIFYYLAMNLISFFMAIPLIKFAKKFGNHITATISIVFFIALQFLLPVMNGNIWVLLLISFVYAGYKRCYWTSRRFFTLHAVHDHVGKSYAFISILHQLSVMAATYIGATLLDGLNQYILIGISSLFLILSLVPLYRIKLKHEINCEKIELGKTLRMIPFEDLVHFGVYELWNVLKFLFPIYITIYVRDNYQTIGIVAVITDLAIIVFSYFFGKRLDSSNRDFLRFTIFLVVITFLIKANAGYLALMAVSFLEGFTTKAFEISLNRNSLLLSKKFEYNNYNLAYELAENFIRLFASLLLFVLPIDLRGDIYLICSLMLLGCLFKFKIPKVAEYNADKSVITDD